MKDTALREFAGLRRAEQRMEREAAELAAALEVFDDDLSEAKREIDAETREEHWGREPAR